MRRGVVAVMTLTRFMATGERNVGQFVFASRSVFSGQAWAAVSVATSRDS